MRGMAPLGSRLAWKLFASHLLIIGVGTVVLWMTAQAVAPVTFGDHLAVMRQHMGRAPAVAEDLLGSFLRPMNAAVAVAAAAAITVAVAVAGFLSRRIVAPIQAMTRASERIASGRYDERVPVTSGDELGRLASQFNRMAGSLQQVERMRRDLIADVAHELRTSLSSVAGYVGVCSTARCPRNPRRSIGSCGRRTGYNGWSPTCRSCPVSRPARSRSNPERSVWASSWRQPLRGCGPSSKTRRSR